MNKTLKEFISMSAKIGNNQLTVQGVGGNTSVKLSQNEMLVKSSGTLLAEMTEHQGYAKINLQKMKEYYSQNNLSNDGWPEEAVLSSIRPSMEVGFHALLPEKFIAHSHPVMLNYFACRKNAEDTLQEIFSGENFSYISFVPPGNLLAKKVSEQRKNNNAKIIVLQNHGLIVCSGKAEEAVEKTFKICEKAQIAALKRGANAFEPSTLKPLRSGFLNSNSSTVKFSAKEKEMPALFPDAAVFTEGISFAASVESAMTEISIVRNQGVYYKCDKKKAKRIDEIINANIYLVSNIPKNDRNVLTDNETNFIRNMESEKFRKKILTDKTKQTYF